MFLDNNHPLYNDLINFINSSLENKKWYDDNIEKILLVEDWIKLDSLIFDIYDLKTIPNNKDIWENKWYIYFSFDAANTYAKWLNKRLPTRDEWKKFVNFLPWKIENKVKFFTDVMKFPLSWFRCRDNWFFCNFWDDCWYWSSSETSTHAYNLHFKSKFINPNDFDFKEIWFLVRCLKN